ncbi:MAG: hypothetical protein RL653_1932 [Pseudomonadota bacterium]|jgi:uncharacterized protein (TIGR02246 family)
MSIREHLVGVGLEQYAERFEQEGISLESAASLTGEQLEKLGVASEAHRATLLEHFRTSAIDLSKGGPAPAAAPPASSPMPTATKLMIGIVLVLGGLALVGLLVALAGGYWWMNRTRGEREQERANAAAEQAHNAAQEELAEVRRRAAEEVEQVRRRAAKDLAAAQAKKEDVFAGDEGGLAGAAEDEETMRQPIDNLYEAWRNLDADLYASQWAPDGTRVDLKSGKVSTAAQVIRSRSALFPKLLHVDAQHTSRLQNFEGGVATFYTRYTMSITSQSGRTTTEVANESYRVKKFNGRWLIIENRDYEP